MDLGQLTRSLAYSLHHDFAQFLIKCESEELSDNKDKGPQTMSMKHGRPHHGGYHSSQASTKNKALLAWAKEKVAILREYRTLIRVPYDLNTYLNINVINEKMFLRRQQIISVFEELRQLSGGLEGLKLPLYSIEEALNIINDGKKRVDTWKLEYVCRTQGQTQTPDFEQLQAMIKDSPKAQDDDLITQKGVFEKIGF